MSEPCCEVVPYREEHEAAIADLLDVLWHGGRDANVAQLRWKYVQSPVREHCHLAVALDRGRVVAVRGLVGGHWQARREAGAEPVTFTALSSSDLVIAPEHRETGLYRLFTERALAIACEAGGYAAGFVFSATPKVKRTAFSAGWHPAFDMERWARQPTTTSGWRKLFRSEGDAAEPLARLADSDHAGPRAVVSIREQARTREMAALVERGPWSGAIRQVRSDEWIRWRYARPGAVYRFLYADGDDGLLGYLVLSGAQDGQGAVRVLDYEAADDEILGDLLEAAVESAGRFRLELWAEGALSFFAERLQRLGFRRTPTTADAADTEGPTLLVRVLEPDGFSALEHATGRRLRERADWDLRPAYSDSY